MFGRGEPLGQSSPEVAILRIGYLAIGLLSTLFAIAGLVIADPAPRMVVLVVGTYNGILFGVFHGLLGLPRYDFWSRRGNRSAVNYVKTFMIAAILGVGAIWTDSASTRPLVIVLLVTTFLLLGDQGTPRTARAQCARRLQLELTTVFAEAGALVAVCGSDVVVAEQVSIIYVAIWSIRMFLIRS